MRSISLSVHLSKPISDKYPNCLRSHKFNNLALVAEAKNTIGRNSGVGNVYTFLHATFEGF